MTLGLFDLPAPLLQWGNERLTSVLPDPAAVALWAVLGAILVMELYRITSPQQRIGHIKQQAHAARLALARYEGEMEGAWPLMKTMLGLSLKRVGIVLPATLLAAYPVIVLLVWLTGIYDYRYPRPGEPVSIDVTPPLEARWVGGQGAAPQIRVINSQGQVAQEIPLFAPVTVLHKRKWWNVLLANPAGYLPPGAPIDQIRIHLPKREFFDEGPSWLRGWEAIFLPVLFVVALAYKTIRRIE